MAEPKTIDETTEVLTLAQAIAAIAALVAPLGDHEDVALDASDGRILAEPLAAPCDLPPFDNAAVDGYALAAADLAATRELTVAGRVAAGAPGDVVPKPGTAVRIFTGARMPPATDTVVMQEQVARRGERVVFSDEVVRGANVRLRGEDVAQGAPALPAGLRLRPQDLALAAALGVDRLRVARRPRVALFSTGDELVRPGGHLGASQRFDSNRPMLAALLVRAGAAVSDLGILPDDRAAISAALATAEPSHDVILTSGGVSVGEGDHVKAAVEARGALALWRLAIKPGRPLAFGRVGATPFVGLPGNPVAVFVTFVRVLRPLLAQLTGESYAPTSVPVVADFTHRKREGLREFVRVALRQDADGVARAQKRGVEGAAILTSLTKGHGLVELDENVTRVEPGDVVAFLPFEGLL